jgi:hypothetical protein
VSHGAPPCFLLSLQLFQQPHCWLVTPPLTLCGALSLLPSGKFHDSDSEGDAVDADDDADVQTPLLRDAEPLQLRGAGLRFRRSVLVVHSVAPDVGEKKRPQARPFTATSGWLDDDVGPGDLYIPVGAGMIVWE